MKDIRIHYKSLFKINKQDEILPKDLWEILVRQVGSWIYGKFHSQMDCSNVIDKWLFEGGKWHQLRSQVYAETDLYNPSNTIPPKYWSLRLEHPDINLTYRKWRTDICLTRNESDSITVTVIVSNYILSEYIGTEPNIPLSSAPGIVDNIFRSFENVFSGTQKLYGTPQFIEVGRGRELWDELIDQNRLCPLIIIRPDDNNEINFDFQNLSKVVLGNANVYCLEHNDVVEELKYFFGKNYKLYSCPKNSIRVYQPKINFSNSRDYLRHRYFGFNAIENGGEIINIVAKGLLRTEFWTEEEYLASYEDISRKKHSSRLSELKDIIERTSQENDEYIDELAQENTKLVEEIYQLKDKIHENDYEFDFLNLEKNELERDLKNEISQLNNIMSCFEKEKAELLKKSQLLVSLKELPKDLNKVIEIIEIFHPEKVCFLDESKQSAKDSNFDDIPNAWSLLWSMATCLWQLYFNDDLDTANIEDEFKRESGFNLSFREGKQTNKDNKLMAQRKRIYNGVEIDITAHTKIEKGNKSLRVHYYVDKTNQKLVIGHCGNHLDNYSTKKLK